MGRKLNIKSGASLVGLQLEMRKVLVVADLIWRQHNQGLTVTEGTGGEHSAGSLHYYGLAVDLRIWGFDDIEAGVVATELQEAVGGDYDVILHKGSHIHVEYDPK